MTRLSIGHIINPVTVGRSSDLYTAQPITFESMRAAKEYVRGEIDVRQYAAFYPEDETLVPGFIEKTPVLERSVADIKPFKVERKLPLVGDILDRLYQACDADYYIYTNVDIALMPYFYSTVRQIIEEGHDGFLINRRTLTREYDSLDQLPLMYADPGEVHPGHDCFVFKRDIYPRFILGRCCLGVMRVARFIIANIIAFSRQFKEFKELHATFHLGDERSWNNPEYNDYYYYHVTELVGVLEQLGASPHVVNPEALKDYYKTNLRHIRHRAANYPETGYLQTLPPGDQV